MPVCSPKLLRERGRPLKSPADLRHHVLLHYDDPERPMLERMQGVAPEFTLIVLEGLVVTALVVAGLALFDYDDDGFPDLFVANDSNPNFLYRNRGDGRFENVGLVSGVAVNATPFFIGYVFVGYAAAAGVSCAGKFSSTAMPSGSMMNSCVCRSRGSTRSS